MRFSQVLLTVGCLLSVAADARGTNEGIYLQDLPGCYWEKIEGESVENPKKIVTAYNYVQIKRDSQSGNLSFSAEVVGGQLGNLHYCSAEGDLEPSDFGDLMVLQFKPNDEQSKDKNFLETPCRLQIIVTPKRMVFYEPDRACQEYFACGVGVGLHGASLGRQHKKPPKNASVCPP